MWNSASITFGNFKQQSSVHTPLSFYYPYSVALIVTCDTGEGPCLATFWVSRFWELLVVRIATGISLGGTMPLIFSLMGDLFPESQRPAVAAGVQLALGLGLAMGQAIAAFAGNP